MSADVIFDYHTGQATLVVAFGMSSSGTGGQITVSSGYILGEGDAVPNYASGGNTTVSYSLPSGLGISVTSNSGALPSNPLVLQPVAATALQGTFSMGLVSLLGGVSVAQQSTIKQVPLGSFILGPASALVDDVDRMFTLAQVACDYH
jgi:hypothetical protein